MIELHVSDVAGILFWQKGVHLGTCSVKRVSYLVCDMLFKKRHRRSIASLSALIAFTNWRTKVCNKNIKMFTSTRIFLMTCRVLLFNADVSLVIKSDISSANRIATINKYLPKWRVTKIRLYSAYVLNIWIFTVWHIPTFIFYSIIIRTVNTFVMPWHLNPYALTVFVKKVCESDCFSEKLYLYTFE